MSISLNIGYLAAIACAAVVSIPSSAEAAPEKAAPINLESGVTNQWQIASAPGDSASVSAVDKCLTLNFDTEVKTPHQIGHRQYNSSHIDLLLKKPIALPADADKVVFETFGGFLSTAVLPYDAVQVWPLLGDSKGETFAYIPRPVASLVTSKDGWNRAITASFYSGEAGGATHDIYEASGGDGNAWPDGQLKFLGFRAMVFKSEPGRKKGSVSLGETIITRGPLPVENPYFYADSVLTKAGQYRFAGEVATDFQALPVRGFDQSINFDPTNVASRKQKLAVPLGKEGDYWIKYLVSDANGQVVTSKDTRFNQLVDAPVQAASAVTSESVPAANYVRVNPNRKEGGVYRGPDPMDVQLRVFPKGKKDLKVSWQLLQYAFNTPVESGQQNLAFTGQPFQDIALTLRGNAGRDAYRLKVEVFDGANAIDLQEYVLGRVTDFSQPRNTRPGPVVSRDLLKQTSYYRSTYIESRNKAVTEDEYVAKFKNVVDETGSLARNWTIAIDIAQAEILPGVYDFALLDRLMDASADLGIGITLRVAHADQEAPFRWARYSRQVSNDGLEIPENFYGGFAVTDPQYLEMWHRLNRAFYDRYREHRAFQGYYLMQPSGEATIQDKPFMGIVAGYEKPTAQFFRDYLKNDLGLSLEALNLRWKKTYKSWDEVFPPQPTFKMGTFPDLSMAWFDFSNFKLNLGKQWFRAASKRIRSYDKDRVIIVYGMPVDRELIGWIDFFHNGGNHYLQKQGELEVFWDKGKIGWINEPHHPTRWAQYGDPAERGWVLDWTIWVAIAQAGGGGANMHIYYDQGRPLLVNHYGDNLSYDRFQKFKPVLDELQRVKLQNPPTQVAVLQRPLTLAAKHRTTFRPRMDDLRHWFELLDVDSITREEFNEEKASNYKLVLPNLLDEVLSDADIRSLEKIVRENGAKMIISANTGKYSPERGEQPFQLLRQLGITPPTGAYIQNDSGVMAKPTLESPLFKQGQQIPFFTLGQLRQDAKEPGFKDRFWQYPYRWIPETDYFGYYRDNQTTNGEVLARFASGGVAVSSHKVGKGEVIVFWGTPDFQVDKLGYLMSRAATWAGVQNPRSGNPISLMVEANAADTGRNYALLYQEKPGHYVQRLPATPDGQWYVVEMVSDRRIGEFSGKDLREKGVPLDFLQGATPLQVLRLTPRDKITSPWANKPLATAINN